jgi:hypothetical protein
MRNGLNTHSLSEKGFEARHWWLIPVILGTLQRQRPGGSVQGQPRQKVILYLKNVHTHTHTHTQNKASRMAQVVERLLSKCEALSFPQKQGEGEWNIHAAFRKG